MELGYNSDLIKIICYSRRRRRVTAASVIDETIYDIDE
jgi:hypothetical protein